MAELSLDLPLMAFDIVGLRVGVILSFQAYLLQLALRDFASVAWLPRFEDVERVAHEIIGSSGHRAIRSSDHRVIENLSVVRSQLPTLSVLTLPHLGNVVCNGQRTTGH